jgi:hypothetical protein
VAVRADALFQAGKETGGRLWDLLPSLEDVGAWFDAKGPAIVHFFADMVGHIQAAAGWLGRFVAYLPSLEQTMGAVSAMVKGLQAALT